MRLDDLWMEGDYNFLQTIKKIYANLTRSQLEEKRIRQKKYYYRKIQE